MEGGMIRDKNEVQMDEAKVEDVPEVHDKIDRKQKWTVRYVSFNVNGVNTLFNYHPWNKFRRNYDKLLGNLEGDIISFQELKLSSQNIASSGIGLSSKYLTFVSIPKKRKGYSGVGLFVRVPEANEPDAVKSHLTVMKSEEGITGYLESPDYPGKKYRDLEQEDAIGGYPSITQERALELDGEGRCVCVELANKLVVFSVYCPANSTATSEGEAFRLEFLKILLDRCMTLKNELGKDVVLMGDINVCLDLIDHAETLNNLSKEKIITINNDTYTRPAESFESRHMEQCMSFKRSTPARELLNKYVIPSIKDSTIEKDGQFLYDTTRLVQKRKWKLYTVWNTITSAREINYGSRIDLILVSSEFMKQGLTNAGVWQNLLGSDHCPVFADFYIDPETPVPLSSVARREFKLEARRYFNFVKHRDILSMFSANNKRKREIDPAEETDKKKSDSSKSNVKYISNKEERKKLEQMKIGHFFYDDRPISSNDDNPVPKKNSTASFSISAFSEQLYGKPPCCLHGLPCNLKTSMKQGKNKGRRFWSCSKPVSNRLYENTVELNSELQCNYFSWATKRD